MPENINAKLFQELIIVLYRCCSQMDFMINKGKREKVTCDSFYKHFLKAGYLKELSSTTTNNIVNKHKAIGNTFYNNLQKSDIREKFEEAFKQSLKQLYPVCNARTRNLFDELKKTYENNDTNHRFPTLEYNEDRYIESISAIFFNSLNADNACYDIRINFKSDHFPTRYFCGRNDEYYRLEEIIKQQRYAIISGDPGMGKTELAYHYAEKHNNDYEKRFMVRFQRSIEFTLAKLLEKTKFDHSDLTTEQKYDIVSDALRKHSKKILLIIDAVDSIVIDDDLINMVSSTGCDFIITTRYRAKEAIILSAMKKRDLNALIKWELGEEKYLHFKKNKGIDVLLEQSKSNTMLTVLLAKMLSVQNIETIIFFYEPSHFNRLVYTEMIQHRKYCEAVRTLTFHKHTLELFSIEYLPDIHKHICYFLYNFRHNKLNREFIKKCCPICNDDEIDFLNKLSILEVLKENENEFYHFSYFSISAICHTNNCIDTDFRDEISAISNMIDNHCNYDRPILEQLFKLAITLKGTSQEWIECRKKIANHLMKYDSAELKRYSQIIYNQLYQFSTTNSQNVYFDLIRSFSETKKYLSYLQTKEEFIDELNTNALLIKEWLKHSDLLIATHTPYQTAKLSHKIARCLMHYLTDNFNKIEIRNTIDIGETIETLNCEMNSVTFKETRMYRIIKKHYPTIKAEEIPSTFSDIRIYKKICFYTIYMILLDCFYEGQNNNYGYDYLAMIYNAFSRHTEALKYISDDNKLFVGCNRVDMLVALQRYNEASELLVELEDTASLINNRSYLEKYIIQYVVSKSTLNLTESINNLIIKSSQIKLSDMASLAEQSIKFCETLLKNKSEQYEILKNEDIQVYIKAHYICEMTYRVYSMCVNRCISQDVYMEFANTLMRYNENAKIIDNNLYIPIDDDNGLK